MDGHIILFSTKFNRIFKLFEFKLNSNINYWHILFSIYIKRTITVTILLCFILKMSKTRNKKHLKIYVPIILEMKRG